jgi:hypothetical protein
MYTDCDFTLVATGNISQCRFVKVATSADETCTQAVANEITVGITSDGTRNAPGTLADDGFIAIAGEQTPIFGTGRKCLLELGGTIVRGDRLKSDANGKGVAALTTGTTVQEVGARALQSGISGQRVLVLVEQYPFRPALS